MTTPASLDAVGNAAAKFYAARRRAERAAGRLIIAMIESRGAYEPGMGVTGLGLDARALVALCGASRARISAALKKMPL